MEKGMKFKLSTRSLCTDSKSVSISLLTLFSVESTCSALANKSSRKAEEKREETRCSAIFRRNGKEYSEKFVPR